MYDEGRQQPQTTWPIDIGGTAQQAADVVSKSVRQLLPFPAADIGALPLLSRGRTVPAGDALPSAATAAADVVSTAARILDEEMARGVLAAKNVPSLPGGTSATGGEPANALLRQVHEMIDSIARAWPDYGATGRVADRQPQPPPTAAPHDPLPELTPASKVRPGEQTTLTMMVRNNESRPVSLVPAATPLLGSTGERIAAQLLEFAPRQLRLEAGQQQQLRITLTVPARCAGGRFSGLMVVSGVDYLRALITVDVDAGG